MLRTMTDLIVFGNHAFVYVDLEALAKLIKKLCSIKREFILLDFSIPRYSKEQRCQSAKSHETTYK